MKSLLTLIMSVFTSSAFAMGSSPVPPPSPVPTSLMPIHYASEPGFRIQGRKTIDPSGKDTDLNAKYADKLAGFNGPRTASTLQTTPHLDSVHFTKTTKDAERFILSNLTVQFAETEYPILATYPRDYTGNARDIYDAINPRRSTFYVDEVTVFNGSQAPRTFVQRADELCKIAGGKAVAKDRSGKIDAILKSSPSPSTLASVRTDLKAPLIELRRVNAQAATVSLASGGLNVASPQEFQSITCYQNEPRRKMIQIALDTATYAKFEVLGLSAGEFMDLHDVAHEARFGRYDSQLGRIKAAGRVLQTVSLAPGFYDLGTHIAQLETLQCDECDRIDDANEAERLAKIEAEKQRLIQQSLEAIRKKYPVDDGHIVIVDAWNLVMSGRAELVQKCDGRQSCVLREGKDYKKGYLIDIKIQYICSNNPIQMITYKAPNDGYDRPLPQILLSCDPDLR